MHDYNISDDLFRSIPRSGLESCPQVVLLTQCPVHDAAAEFVALRTAWICVRRFSFQSGELTAGIGMTYNYENQAEDGEVRYVARAAFHHNMWTCINNRIDETAYNIEPGATRCTR